MNFYDNIPNFNHQIQGINPQMLNQIPQNNIYQKILELENKIKKLELRISQLETEKNNNNYIEPDNSLYMI